MAREAEAKLRSSVAREAESREVAATKLRRLLAFYKSFNSTGVQIGDTALIYESAGKKGAPRWAGPAKI